MLTALIQAALGSLLTEAAISPFSQHLSQKFIESFIFVYTCRLFVAAVPNVFFFFFFFLFFFLFATSSASEFIYSIYEYVIAGGKKRCLMDIYKQQISWSDLDWLQSLVAKFIIIFFFNISLL